MSKVLVAYASKHNATAEIATAICEEIRECGELDVDIRPVETVEDIAPYDAVVLGSAIYAGQWQPGAADFLKGHERELAQRPVWLFSSGPTGKGDPKALMRGWTLPEALRPAAERIHPRDIAVFQGRLDPESLNFFERSIVKMVHADAFGIGDFRDWDMIRAWADTIAHAL